MKHLFSFLVFFTSSWAFSQQGTIVGRVYNSVNNESLPTAKVQVVGMQKGGVTDENGAFRISGLEPGVYAFKAMLLGFEPMIIDQVSVTNTRQVTIDFALEEKVQQQKEVKVVANPFRKPKESPVSLNTLNSAEIERLPGANRDVSKVLQSLPGVASQASFRNDVIIRGGAPGENKFYLDGIEVPNINHFATQGSSGGPNGLLNVNFIREVELYTGSFPSNYANGLSSVISFKQKEGNSESLLTNIAIGSSDLALTLDGPIRKKANFIFSARRSYLRFLFSILKLPFLPTYNDSQFKVNYRINSKNKISIIGLGALDDFVLNTSVNDGVDDPQQLELNNYYLDNIPTQDQWNYTIGLNYVHYGKNSFQRVVVSRNMLKNLSEKYAGNVVSEANKLLDYESFEAENKLRFEHTYRKNGYRLKVGVGYEYARYFNSTFSRSTIGDSVITVDVTSSIDLHKGSVFGQLTKSFFDEHLDVTVGVRSDISSYNEEMMNPIDQLSPSLSLSYHLNEQWSINANVSRYHQLPAYTVLGFRNINGEFVNRENGLKYIRADHAVAGVSYFTSFMAKFSVEGFYKNYSNYPFSINDSISLANQGSGFGIVGNESVSSTSEGRAYGLEFLYQQKLFKGFYGILAYTYVNSEFLTKDGNYAPTAWDSKHLISVTGGKRFKGGWEVGFRWLFSGGTPYTPADVYTSSLKPVWDVNNAAVLDYGQLNSQRVENYHQLNIRIDKRYEFKKVSLNIYMDIQNVYNQKTRVAPILLVERDNQGNPLTDPNDPSRYQTKFVENTYGFIQPTFGTIFEFRIAKRKPIESAD